MNRTVPLEHFNLEKFKFVAEHEIDPMALEHYAERFGEQATLQLAEDLSRRLSLMMIQRVWGQQLEMVKEEWPADWWQAVKLRFFPKWALRRWPARMKRIEIDVKALLPKFAAPTDHCWIPYVAKTNAEYWKVER